MDKDMKRVLAAAREQGFTVDPTADGHLQVKPPAVAAGIVHIRSKASDHRSLRNAIADLRKAGLEWPPPRKGRAA